MADIAKLVASLELQSAQFQKELEKANKKLDRFHKDTVSAAQKIKSAFTGVFAGLVGFQTIRSATTAILDFAKSADHLGEFSQQVGISVKSLSTLEKAAEQFGVEAQSFETSLVRLSKAAVSAGEDIKSDAADAFAALGISVKNAEGSFRGTEDLLLDIADRFAAMSDGAAKTALAVELFGRSGAQLIPFLNEGRGGIEDLREELRRLGVEISDATAKTSDEFTDALTNLGNAASGVGRQFAEGLIPSVTDIATAMIDVGKDADSARQAFRRLGEDIGFLAKIIATVLAPVVTALQSTVFDPLVNISRAGLNVLTGNFSEAAKDIGRIFSDIDQNGKDLLDFWKRLWSEAPAATVAGAGVITGALQDLNTKIVEFGITGLKAAEEEQKKQEAAAKAAAAGIKRIADEQARAIESARQSLEGLAQSAQQQAETFGLSETAVAQYRVTVGDLADEVRLAGDAGLQAASAYVEWTRTIEENERAQKELADTQQRLRQESEDNAAQFDRLKPLISGVDAEAQRYAETIRDLEDALAKGNITQAQFEVGVESATKEFENAGNQATEFARRAAEGIQDAFADFLFDPFDKGLKGMLDNVVKTLNRIAAEIVAAQISKALFGDFGGSTGSAGGGLFGKIGSIFGGIFGGARAFGGPVMAGSGYMVGEYGPEFFIPNTSGHIIPHSEMGGMVVNVYNQISAPGGNVSRQSITQLETATGLSVRRALARNS